MQLPSEDDIMKNRIKRGRQALAASAGTTPEDLPLELEYADELEDLVCGLVADLGHLLDAYAPERGRIMRAVTDGINQHYSMEVDRYVREQDLVIEREDTA